MRHSTDVNKGQWGVMCSFVSIARLILAAFTSLLFLYGMRSVRALSAFSSPRIVAVGGVCGIHR